MSDEASSIVPDPDPRALEAFWTRARNVGDIYPLEVILGQDDIASLRPPAFSFGDVPELADRLAKLVLDGRKTATSGWLATYEAEGVELPEAGDLSIMCDGRGEPLALLRDTEVRVLGFQEADGEISDAEGEGPFEEWKTAHEDFFARECEATGIDYDPAGSIVVEFFEVLYARDLEKAASVPDPSLGEGEAGEGADPKGNLGADGSAGSRVSQEPVVSEEEVSEEG